MQSGVNFLQLPPSSDPKNSPQSDGQDQLNGPGGTDIAPVGILKFIHISYLIKTISGLLGFLWQRRFLEYKTEISDNKISRWLTVMDKLSFRNRTDRNWITIRELVLFIDVKRKFVIHKKNTKLSSSHTLGAIMMMNKLKE